MRTRDVELEGFEVVKDEATFAFAGFFAVTFVAVLFEDGLDVFFEVGGTGRGGGEKQEAEGFHGRVPVKRSLAATT